MSVKISSLCAKESWLKNLLRRLQRKPQKLTKSELKSISSLKSQILKHEENLTEYIKDPMRFDNKDFLKNAPNDLVREKIIQLRVNHLDHEIDVFQENINKILNKQ